MREFGRQMRQHMCNLSVRCAFWLEFVCFNIVLLGGFAKIMAKIFETAPFRWIGGSVDCYNLGLDNNLNTFYRSFKFRGEKFELDDFAVVRCSGHKEKICRLLTLYESAADWHKNAKFRAIVKWYTYARDLPTVYTQHIAFDNDNEVVEDLRNSDKFISLEDIQRKCIITYATPEDPVHLISEMLLDASKYFSCRYRIKKTKLIPIFEDVCEMSDLTGDRDATPLFENNVNSPGIINRNLLLSPEAKFASPNRARRNLNESFGSQDVLNYSVVAPEDETPLKIKLKLSLNQPTVFLEQLDLEKLKEGTAKCKIGDDDEDGVIIVVEEEKMEIEEEKEVKEVREATPRRSTRAVSRKSYADYTSPRKTRLKSTEENLMLVALTRNSKKQKENAMSTPRSRKHSEGSPSKKVKKSVLVEENKNVIINLSEEETASPKRTLRMRTRSMSTESDRCQIELTPVKKIKPETPRSGRGRPRSADKKVENTPRKRTATKTIEELTKEVAAVKLSTPVKDKPLKKIEDVAVTPVRSKRISAKPVRYQYDDYDYSEKLLKKTVATPKTKDVAMTPVKTRRASTKPLRYQTVSDDDDLDFCSSPKKTLKLTPKKTVKLPQTPKSGASFRKQLNQGMITPSTQKRDRAVTLPSTPLNLAREKLHVSYVPQALPCREKEFDDIFAFVQGKLFDGCGGCIYISGVPGTGKTATVTGVVKCLKDLEKTSEVPKFSYVGINGMRLTEPRQAYVEILKQLGGQTVAWEQALSMLDARFTKKQAKKQLPVVLLVDELDILCTKRQDVVYNLLDWPTKATAQLIVITIANTMDLPERLLMGRVTSRLGLTRLTFQAYTHKQLQEIVTKRLLGTNSFNPDAIQLAARKVASVSGDARRALDICRRAAEIAELEGPATLVSMSHVNEALNAMITQPKVLAIKHCSRLEQLLLQAVVAEVERTGVDETTFGDVYRMLQTISGIDGFRQTSMSLGFAAVSRLSSCRLLLSDQKSSDVHQKLILNVSSDDIYFAMRRD